MLSLSVKSRAAGAGRPKILLLMLVLTLLGTILTGCATPSGQQGNSTTPAAAKFPLTFADDMGRKVTLAAQPQKLISLAPSNTEILFALGLGEKVVGVDDYSDYPPEAAAVAKIGGFSKPNVEKIVDLKPDLVLASSMHEQAVKQLEQLGVPTAVVDPKTVDEVLTSIKWIGRATGAEERAGQLVAQMEERIQRVRALVQEIPEEKKPLVYYEVYSDPLMSAGPKTLIGQLIELAGGRNIARTAETDYPKFSAEAIIKANPEIIIFPRFHGTASLTVEQVKARSGWEEISAIKNNRIYSIDANIISRPGPRVVEALEQLTQMIHPELLSK